MKRHEREENERDRTRIMLHYLCDTKQTEKKIPPTHKKATWTAAGLFELEDGKIKSFVKEWNKLPMWQQLGKDNAIVGCYTKCTSHMI